MKKEKREIRAEEEIKKTKEELEKEQRQKEMDEAYEWYKNLF